MECFSRPSSATGREEIFPLEPASCLLRALSESRTSPIQPSASFQSFLIKICLKIQKAELILGEARGSMNYEQVPTTLFKQNQGLMFIQ